MVLTSGYVSTLRVLFSCFSWCLFTTRVTYALPFCLFL